MEKCLHHQVFVELKENYDKFSNVLIIESHGLGERKNYILIKEEMKVRSRRGQKGYEVKERENVIRCYETNESDNNK